MKNEKKKTKKPASKALTVGDRVRGDGNRVGTVTEIGRNNTYPYMVKYDDERESTHTRMELELLNPDELMWEAVPIDVRAAVERYADAVADVAIAREAGGPEDEFLADVKEDKRRKELARILHGALGRKDREEQEK